MSMYKKKQDFIESEEGIMVLQELKAMVLDKSYMTDSSFSTNTEKYNDNLIPFVDKHMDYLKSHPSTNPLHYIANLKLMTRIRR